MTERKTPPTTRKILWIALALISLILIASNLRQLSLENVLSLIIAIAAICVGGILAQKLFKY